MATATYNRSNISKTAQKLYNLRKDRGANVWYIGFLKSVRRF